MPTKILQAICDITGARADWLLFGEGPTYRSPGIREVDEVPAVEIVGDIRRDFVVKGERLRDVPVLARVPAGPPAPNDDQGTPVGVGAEGYVVVHDPDDPNAFALIVESDSMLPVLRPGDIIVVSPRRKEDLRLPVAVVKLRGEDVAVKYLKISETSAILESANDEYPPIEVPLGQIEVVGRVIEMVRRMRE